MSVTPRLRVLAGPNGSGKSTLLQDLLDVSRARGFSLGIVLNPDEFERELVASRRIDLAPWGVHCTDEDFAAFVTGHALHERVCGPRPRVEDNALVVPGDFESGYYIPIVSDFLRGRWIATSKSFAFETVMSSHDKVDFLAKARSAGYRVYLYYICTATAWLNQQRIRNRVAQGGHDVPSYKVELRYTRSLSLVPDAIRLSHRAYFFDNSGLKHRLVAEFDSGVLVKAAEDLPNWFIDDVLKPLAIV